MDLCDKAKLVVIESVPNIVKATHVTELSAAIVEGGITNHLVRVGKLGDGDGEDVLVRFFGTTASEGIPNRKREQIIIDLLGEHGLCKTVFKRFAGGRIEQWLNGEAADTESMSCPNVSRGVASQLGCLHSVEVPAALLEAVQEEALNVRLAVPLFGRLSSSVATDMNGVVAASKPGFSFSASLLDNLPTECSTELIDSSTSTSSPTFPNSPGAAVNNGSAVSCIWVALFWWLGQCRLGVSQGMARSQGFRFFDLTVIEERLSSLYKHCLEKQRQGNHFGYDFVLSHNDLLSGNILSMKDGTVQFIDYEYAGPAERAFDIANHFCEYCGFECQWDRFPDVAARTRFIRMYVDAVLAGRSADSEELEDERKEMLVNELHDAVLLFVNVSHMFWGLWAFSQAVFSNVDFDFRVYAFKRLHAAFANIPFQEGSTAELNHKL